MFKPIFLLVLLLFTSHLFAQVAMPELSDSVKVVFSHKAGFYTDNFSLELSVPNESYDLLYTIDGSNPQTSKTAQNGGKSKTITINPSLSVGRPATPCFLVRASLTKNGFLPSKPESRTFIFLDKVVGQKNPGGGWPKANVNTQWIDLEMDEKVTTSAKYKNSIQPSLLGIPSISIITDLPSLFDAKTGIYVNADEHGEDWERFCSVELIDSKNSSNQFNINAGLRIRGGWSRHGNYPKHAFRLFFNKEYGAGKLEFPLFGDEGADEFDKIDLRCEQNYSWSNVQGHNTFVREVFSRDTQRDMKQPYTRSRYYHLYLNGMYWGLYQTQERAEAHYAATYFGGSDEDYDVIKVNTEGFNYHIEASDGNTDVWESIWKLCESGFSSNEVYFALEGKNAYGEPEKGKEVFVDIDNLIDYMLVIFYTGNFDSPTTAFGNNSGPNNFYTINKRDDKTKGFIFFCHDAEHSMMIDPISPGIGIEENRVEPAGMTVNSFPSFHPQWLHHKLTENDEYRQRFADRVYKHFYNKGALSQTACEQRFQKRVDEVDAAVVAESARWGDTGSSVAKTKDFDWLPEIEELFNNFFPYRGDIVLDQLVDAGLFSYIDPPQVKMGETLVESEVVKLDRKFTISLNDVNKSSQIYYTLDGSDPRLVNGAVNPLAINAPRGETINLECSQLLNCRSKRDNKWSPLRTVKFIVNYEDYHQLKLTELHYNPLDSVIGTDTVAGKSFEFIELKNVGKESVDLTGLKISNSIKYQFKENELLPPGKFYVIASSSKWFFERYGLVPSGNFENSLSNDGELVILKNKQNEEVFYTQYDNTDPWPTGTNGEGYSLSSAGIYPIGNPNDYTYWKRSTFINGSPFRDDTGFPVNTPENTFELGGITIYPNPSRGLLFFNMNDNGESEVTAELITAEGRTIFNGTIGHSSVIDLRSYGLRSGLLMLKLTSNGNTTIKRVLYQK
jgi:hypothetical protein